MTTSLSNLSLSNAIYSVTGSNTSGTLTINQPTTSSFLCQFSPWIASNMSHNYSLSVRDATSNITVTLNGSNMIISNQSSNLFNTYVLSFISTSNFNTISLNRYDNSLIVGLNTSNIVRITSSNELPISFDNSSIRITASNAGQFKDIGYNSIATVDTPMQFNKSVKFASSITASNIASLNLSAMTSNIAWTSNTATIASNVAYWSSNTALFGSNQSILNSNNINALSLNVSSLSNLVMFSSNTAIWSSNTALFGSNQSVMNSNNIKALFSNVSSLSNLAMFLSNTAIWSSNTALFGSNQGILNSNNINTLSSNVSSLSNLAMFSSNTAIWSSNTALFGSNQGVLNSNNINIVSSNVSLLSNASFLRIGTTECNLQSLSNTVISLSNSVTTLSNNIISTNTTIINYSNYESNRVTSLSNFAYSIQSSNSVVNNFYTSNIITKNITSSDGGTIGALLMSGAGLALSGYNLLNQNGRLVNSLQDTLGKLNINPNGSVELQSLLGKTGRYTDSVQIGVSTIELSNNVIFFKDGTLSNTTVTSNAITVLNSNIINFTISNANIVTNCNVSATNITALSNQLYSTNDTAFNGSNVAYWSSNNLVKKSGDYITILSTDKILLPASANLIGSGWNYITGWTASGALGGYVLRNSGVGGLEIYTGLSNGGLGMAVTVTSNGNVGVGTYTPTYKLDVTGNTRLNNALIGDAGHGSTYAGFAHSSTFTTGGYALLSEQNGETYVNCASGRNIRFRVNNIDQGVWNTTGLGIGTISPSAKLHVNGLVKVSGFADAIGLSVSNNTSPCIEVNNGSNALNMGVTNITGGYSSDASINDAIIRHTGGKLLLQSGQSASAICITTANNVGIGTTSPTSKLDVSGTIYNTITGGANATFTVGQRLKCDASEAYWYWRNSNLGLDITNPFNNLGSTKRHIIFNEYADASSGFVGIGTSSPSSKLDVNGTINATNYTGTTITNLSNLGVWSSNTSVWGSNTAIWGSNTARWSSNYGATLCNLGTDALSKGMFGSNTSVWTSNNFAHFRTIDNFLSPLVCSAMYHSGVATPSTDFAICQFNTGLTVLNHSTGTSIDIKEGNNRYATFKSYKCLIGNDQDPTNTLDVIGNAQITQELTLKRGTGAAALTFTHLPYVGDGKNYIRGTTIIADNGGKVGIGGVTSPAYELDVFGTTKTTNLMIGQSNTAITYLWVGNVSIGTNGTSKKTVTVSIPTALQPSSANYLIYYDYQSANDDIFIGKTRNKGTTSFDIVTYRADGGSWATAPTCYFMVVGYS